MQKLSADRPSSLETQRRKQTLSDVKSAVWTEALTEEDISTRLSISSWIMADLIIIRQF